HYVKKPVPAKPDAASSDGAAEEEGADGGEENTPSFEPEYILDLVPAGQLTDGLEIVEDPLGLANLPSPATMEDVLPAAYAACREAARRTKNMRHFDVQIVGGVILHRGNIAEMVTGEGTTLVAPLP